MKDELLEKEFIQRLAMVSTDEKFIVSSLRLMDSDSKRRSIISFIDRNDEATRRDIEVKMFRLSI